MRFMNRCACVLALLAIFCLAACAPPDPESPIQLTSDGLETQIAAIRRSATVAAERMQITVVGARSQLEQVYNNYNALRGTLTARGYDPSAIRPPTTAVANAPPPESSNTPTLAITPPATRTTSQPNATRSAPSLSDFRIGLEIGSDDCVAVPIPSLAADVPAIYASARAQNLPADAELRTRWFTAGAERSVLTYSPDFAIADNCVWFFIEPSDTPFVPGVWEVIWELESVAQPRQSFTITPN